VLYGGVAVDTVVDSGGDELVQSGIASRTTVSSGGVVSVYALGTATAGGLVEDATVLSGGRVVIQNHATLSGVVVSSGGSVIVSSGGQIDLTGSLQSGVTLMAGALARQSSPA
jgi:autotransporter passenger strand-loop-strand repeat protein